MKMPVDFVGFHAVFKQQEGGAQRPRPSLGIGEKAGIVGNADVRGKGGLRIDSVLGPVLG